MSNRIQRMYSRGTNPTLAPPPTTEPPVSEVLPTAITTATDAELNKEQPVAALQPPADAAVQLEPATITDKKLSPLTAVGYNGFTVQLIPGAQGDELVVKPTDTAPDEKQSAPLTMTLRRPGGQTVAVVVAAVSAEALPIAEADASATAERSTAVAADAPTAEETRSDV